MVLVSYSGREINAKLVYYGPGLSGKTTNLESIYGSIPQGQRGKMVSMKTKTERTLFFDFLPVNLGELSGFKTRFLLYTVPGQVYYNATRKLVLKGVDAVVFVADSKRGKMDENVESLENLKENLKEHGLSLDQVPWVIQYNKRDLPDVYTLEELETVLNPTRVPAYEGVATTGHGVVETFKGVSRLLLRKLAKDIGVTVVHTPEAQAAPEVAPGPAITPPPPVPGPPPISALPTGGAAAASVARNGVGWQAPAPAATPPPESPQPTFTSVPLERVTFNAEAEPREPSREAEWGGMRLVPRASEIENEPPAVETPLPPPAERIDTRLLTRTGIGPEETDRDRTTSVGERLRRWLAGGPDRGRDGTEPEAADAPASDAAVAPSSETALPETSTPAGWEEPVPASAWDEDTESTRAVWEEERIPGPESGAEAVRTDAPSWVSSTPPSPPVLNTSPDPAAFDREPSVSPGSEAAGTKEEAAPVQEERPMMVAPSMLDGSRAAGGPARGAAARRRGTGAAGGTGSATLAASTSRLSSPPALRSSPPTPAGCR